MASQEIEKGLYGVCDNLVELGLSSEVLQSRIEKWRRDRAESSRKVLVKSDFETQESEGATNKEDFEAASKNKEAVRQTKEDSAGSLKGKLHISSRIVVDPSLDSFKKEDVTNPWSGDLAFKLLPSQIVPTLQSDFQARVRREIRNLFASSLSTTSESAARSESEQYPRGATEQHPSAGSNDTATENGSSNTLAQKILYKEQCMSSSGKHASRTHSSFRSEPYQQSDQVAVTRTPMADVLWAKNVCTTERVEAKRQQLQRLRTTLEALDRPRVATT